MSKSRLVRARDVVAIARLIGECRDLGDDAHAWRQRLLEGLSALVDAEGGHTGEMAGCHALKPRDLGVVLWTSPGLPGPASIDAETAGFVRDPKHWASQLAYHRRNRGEGGACLTRKDLLDDRTWRLMPDYYLIRDLFGLDHRMWCFRPIPGAGPDEHVGLILCRADRKRDFAPRDRTVVGLALEMLAPLVGGPLARFAEPSPAGLPPRVRDVLARLLEGDGDKQVAARLGLSRYTVNEYTQTIYRHFGVAGRAELLARWLRLGRRTSLRPGA